MLACDTRNVGFKTLWCIWYLSMISAKIVTNDLTTTTTKKHPKQQYLILAFCILEGKITKNHSSQGKHIVAK